MERVSPQIKVVLNALDEQIAELEAKLTKYKPLLDELARLKRARATLLGEKTVAGRRGTLDTEALVGTMRESREPLTAVEIAQRIGADANTVRAHLNRHLDSAYRKEGRSWVLVGGEATGAMTEIVR